MHRALAEVIELFAAADCHRAEDRAVVERYLAALAPVLARVVLGKGVLGDLKKVERLFGHTWLRDALPYEPAFTKRREFRDEYERFAVQGMTVNERLCAFSLAEDYDRAVTSGDVKAMRSILGAVHVDEASINKIVSSVRGGA